LGKHDTTDFHRARDELFSHIRRCGVLEATPGQRDDWLEDTMDYVRERYPSLSHQEIKELRVLADRYCRPAIPHGDATADDAWSGQEEEVAEAEPAEIESVESAAAAANEAAAEDEVSLA